MMYLGQQEIFLLSSEMLQKDSYLVLTNSLTLMNDTLNFLTLTYF